MLTSQLRSAWVTPEYISMYLNPLTTGNLTYDLMLDSNVAADALVLKHQVISSHNADSMPNFLDEVHKMVTSRAQLGSKTKYEKYIYPVGWGLN